MRKIMSIFCCLSIVIFLCGCRANTVIEINSDTGTVQTPEQDISQQENKHNNKEFIVATIENLENFSEYPFYPVCLFGNVFEGLVYAPNGNVENAKGLLAQNWSVSSGATEWTFSIKPDVYFSDGTLCDAKAIAESWDYSKEAGNIMFAEMKMKEWYVADDNTLVIELNAAEPAFFQRLCAYDAVVFSPNAVKIYGVGSIKSLVGSGPYCLTGYSNEQLVLGAVENYHKESESAKVDKVRIKYIQKEENMVTALISKEIDGCILRDIASYQQLTEDFEGNIMTSYGDSSPIWLNAGSVKAFELFEVRKALSCFIDLNAINQQAYMGLGCVQDSIWAEGTPAYCKANTEFNIDLGYKLLSTVGLGSEDISFVHTRQKNTTGDISLSVTGYFEDALCEQLNNCGVNMEIAEYGAEASVTPLMDGSWSITIQNAGYTEISPNRPWLYSLSDFQILKLCNQELYDSELYNALKEVYSAMAASQNWNELVSHCKEITSLVQDDYSVLPGVQPPIIIAYSNYYSGVTINKLFGIQTKYYIPLNLVYVNE